MVGKPNRTPDRRFKTLIKRLGLAARIVAVAIVLLGGLIWQANAVLRPAVRGPLLITQPAARSTSGTRGRAGPSPVMKPDDTLNLNEMVSALARYQVQVKAQDWSLSELRLLYQTVYDLGAKLAEIGPDDGPTMFYQTVGRVRFRRMHHKELVDKVAQAQFGPAKAWTVVNTITVYDSTFYYDYLEIKATLVHEMGHAWDWHTRGQASRWLLSHVGAEAKPSRYAEDMGSAGEEWAETVAAWVYPAYTHRDGRVLGSRHRQYIESLALTHAPPTRLPAASAQPRLVSWNIGLGAALSSAVFWLHRRSSTQLFETEAEADRREQQRSRLLDQL